MTMGGSGRQAILVTGASGFIGRALVARLQRTGRPSVALARRPFDAPAGVTVMAADLASRRDEHLMRCLEQSDCVIHLAGRAHRGGSDADFAADVMATENLARQCGEAGVRRLVFMSSIGVLGTHSGSSAFTEDTAPAPQEAYAKAKLQAEQALKRAIAASPLTEWVILRPPMVYGPDAPGNFARLLHAVRRGWPLPFAQVRNQRHLVGIDNLLDAILLCIDHPAAANQAFVVCDRDAVSTPQLISLIARGLGVRARLLGVPPALLEWAARLAGRTRLADSLLRDLRVDASKLTQTAGWTPRLPAAEGIVRAAAESTGP